MFYTLRLLLGLAEAGTFPGLWYQLTLFFSTAEVRVSGLPYPRPWNLLSKVSPCFAGPGVRNVFRTYVRLYS